MCPRGKRADVVHSVRPLGKGCRREALSFPRVLLLQFFVAAARGTDDNAAWTILIGSRADGRGPPRWLATLNLTEKQTVFFPGYLVATATFPGVIVHEFAHKLFCILTKTRVLDVCYFRVGTPSGYVIHEPASTVWKSILIAVGPLFANSIIGFLIGMFAGLFFYRLSGLPFLGAILAWVAVSVAMHAFPSTGDAQVIWKAIWTKGAPLPPRLVGTPVVAVIYLGAIGSAFWLDVIYGAMIAILLPMAILDRPVGVMR
jgi:Putative zincin peptidase